MVTRNLRPVIPRSSAILFAPNALLCRFWSAGGKCMHKRLRPVRRGGIHTTDSYDWMLAADAAYSLGDLE